MRNEGAEARAAAGTRRTWLTGATQTYLTDFIASKSGEKSGIKFHFVGLDRRKTMFIFKSLSASCQRRALPYLAPNKPIVRTIGPEIIPAREN